MSDDRDLLTALGGIATATLTTVLLKKGLRNVYLRHTRPIRNPQQRVAGRAFTLRFIPAREDQATPESWAKPTSTRSAIEAMPAGRRTAPNNRDDAADMPSAARRARRGPSGDGPPVSRLTL